MHKKLKVITVDFWNTIFDSSNGLERNEHRIKTLKDALGSLGLDITEESYQKSMQDAWEYFNGIWKNEQRTLSTYESVMFFWNYFKAPKNQELISKVVKTFEESILLFPPNLLDGAKEVIEVLAQKYTLGIISDTGFSPGSVLRQLMERFSILEYFKAFSFSNETGVAKPHPEAYLKILNEMNCWPQNAIHIGDIEETDIDGAKSLQMKAIRFIGNHTDFLNEDSEFHTKADCVATSWYEIPKIIDAIENDE